jgi:hypothetical protein
MQCTARHMLQHFPFFCALVLVPLLDSCLHGSDLCVRVSDMPAKEDLRRNEAEDFCWCPWKFLVEEDAPSTSPLPVIDSALVSVADNQEVDASLCKLAAPALAVPQEDLVELDVSTICCELGNLVQDLGEENMVLLHHCGQHLLLWVVLDSMNFGLCEDTENPEGAVQCEALVDSDPQSQNCSVIEADSISDLHADA